MPDSMSEQLRRNMSCEGLLECFHGLKALDRRVFEVLTDDDAPRTVDEVAEAVDRERSTAYRSIQRLVDAGFVRKEQVNYDQGGYYHVFEPVDADEVAENFQRILNDWYAKMGRLIVEFRKQYGDAERAVPTER
jgi:predicted transcriptional regulator